MSAEEGAGGREKQGTDDLSDEAILRELCAASGCNYERLLENGKDENVMKIEIFFFGYPRICGLHHFPNLTKLCVVNQPIRSLAGLESCDHLTELWVCETALEDMRNVECCVGLVQLYLYSNRISRIQGLDKLVYLEKLWLNSNRLSRLEGLGNLGNLRDLNLAGNTLTSIRGAVEHLRKLEIFDLSGNQISSFEDLSPLSDLPSLHSLSLSHPHHPPNPLSLLCNYSSLLLFSLPQLTTLDGQDVSSPDVKSLVQGLVSKKKMFYRMKVKHEQEVMDRKCHAHQQEVRQLQEVVSGRLRTLHTALGRLKQFYDDTEEEEEEERKREKCRLIQERIEHLTSYLDHITATSSDHLSRLRNELDWQTRLWQIELGSGGNIKFLAPVEGHWHRACTELVKSRFSAANWQEFGFSGVEVRQVLRIENRKLRHRLTSAVQTILEQSGPGSIPPPDDLSDLMEYLFLVWNPELDLLQVCSDGFPERRGSPPVSLTDSIMFADLPRLRHSSGRGQRSRDESGRGNKSRDENQTHLLLCKVFKGQHMEISSSGIPSPSDYPSSHSVCRHANAHSSEWFVFHPALVIPSFLISLRYLTPGPSKSVLDHMTSRDPHTPTDDVILDHAPILPAQPKLALLDEASILRVSNCTDLSDVKDLCLHGNHLTRFRLSSCPSSLTHSLLPNLTTLTLSCNEIHTAEDFHNLPQLVELDLSFNRIATLEGMKNLPKLQKLDVSWNSLTCYFTDVSVLRRHAPALVSFHCSHNPWTSPDLFRRHTLTRLKNLRYLDNTPVTPDDTSAAVAYCTASQLSSSSLSPHIHTLTVPPPSLSLSFITYSLIKLPSPRFTDSIHNWGHKVTSLHLAGRSVRRLSCFDQLPNLLWLCLDNNTISNIEALSLCTKLQEASLDNNHISDLTPLCSLRHLQTLSADGNSLSSLPEPRHLRSLTSLHRLSLSHNQLSDLTPMEVLTSIEELYISSNDIHDRRQLFHLKPLRSLLILSLENNHLATPTPEVGGATGGATHRMFAVYHLHSLRALDGIPLVRNYIRRTPTLIGV
jgi:Leucine-rich repeat (LRR) protein